MPEGQEGSRSRVDWKTCALSVIFVFTGLAVWSFAGPAIGASRPLLQRTQLYTDFRCPERGDSVLNFARHALHQASAADDLLLPQSTSFDEFLKELKVSLERHRLKEQPIVRIFNPESDIHPRCNGDWMEFGVFSGNSINLAANWRKANCAAGCPAVYGFDTFTGLPEVWAQQEGDTLFDQAKFDRHGTFPAVVDNVHLVKGLFSESLPPFLQLRNIWGSKASEAAVPLSYLHIDCDLYAGAHDAFTLLSHKIVPGTIIIFDELINYKLYRLHEVKAFHEWLQVSGAKVATIGSLGPMPNTSMSFDIDIQIKEWPWQYQSAGFVVVSKPGYPSNHFGL